MERMKRKLEIEPENMKGKWGVMQEKEGDIEASGLKQERSVVKEGSCEECGALDVLSKFKEGFMCNKCIRLSEKTSLAKAKVKGKKRSK